MNNCGEEWLWLFSVPRNLCERLSRANTASLEPVPVLCGVFCVVVLLCYDESGSTGRFCVAWGLQDGLLFSV